MSRALGISLRLAAGVHISLADAAVLRQWFESPEALNGAAHRLHGGDTTHQWVSKITKGNSDEERNLRGMEEAWSRRGAIQAITSPQAGGIAHRVPELPEPEDDASRLEERGRRASDDVRDNLSGLWDADVSHGEDGEIYTHVKQSDLIFGDPIADHPCHLHARKGSAADTARDGESKPHIRKAAMELTAIFAAAADKIIKIIERAYPHPRGKAKRKHPAKQLRHDDYNDIDNILRKMADEADGPVKDLIDAAIQDGAVAGLEAIKVDPGIFDGSNRQVFEAVRGFREQIKTQIAKGSIERIRASLAEGIQAGETSAELSARVRDGGVLDNARAEMIARSESARAYTQGQIEAWEQSGVVEGKVWQISDDACPFCEEAAADFNDEAIGLRDSFYRQGSKITAGDQVMELDYADVDGPPLHPACRCSMSAQLTDEGGAE